MKCFFKLVVVSLFALGFTSCSGDSGKFDLLDFLYGSNSRESYEEKQARLAEPFIGSYTCTDALGFTFTLDIKSDKKATLKSGSKTWYGTWDLYLTEDYIYIDMSSGPKIYTNIEYGKGPMYFIKNGYFYNNSTDCEAENPEKRLKLN
jgi:hypothetical protein